MWQGSHFDCFIRHSKKMVVLIDVQEAWDKIWIFVRLSLKISRYEKVEWCPSLVESSVAHMMDKHYLTHLVQHVVWQIAQVASHLHQYSTGCSTCCNDMFCSTIKFFHCCLILYLEVCSILNQMVRDHRLFACKET